MIAGLLWMILANGVLLLGSRALLDQVRSGQSHVDAVLFLLIRLCLMSGIVLIAGISHTLSGAQLGILAAIALAGLISCKAHRLWRWPTRPPVSRLAMVFVGAVLLRLLIQVWYFSPHMGDPLTYHLPKVAEWVRAGAFTREMGTHPHVTFPAGFELVETWWVVFLHHDVLIEMAGVEFLILAFAGTFALARQMGLGERPSYLAGMLYVLTPGLYLNSLSCLNDGAVAALLVSTGSLIMARVHPSLVLLAVGIGLGIKPTYGFALPGMAALWILCRREPQQAVSRPGIASLLGLVALGVGAFWYLRNLDWYGNLIFPVTKAGYDHPGPAQFGPRLGSLILNLKVLVNVCVYDNLGAYAADVHSISGWGAAPFSCGLLALLVGIFRNKLLRRLALAWGISAASTLVLVKLDPWCMRFVFFFPAVLCIAAAWIATIVRGTGTIAAVALAIQFAGTCLPYDLPLRDFMALARQGWKERSSAQLNGANPPTDVSTLACYGVFSGGEYLLYRPDFSRKVTYLRSRSVDELITALRGTNTQLLYSFPLNDSEKDILEQSVAAGYLQKIDERFYRLQ